MTYNAKYARVNQRDVGVRPCQNVIRGERDDWADSRSCGEPAISLGYNGERVRCPQCKANTEAWIQGAVARWASAFVAEYDVDEWLRGTLAIHNDIEDLITRFLRDGRSMSKVMDVRHDLAIRRRHLEAVLEHLNE